MNLSVVIPLLDEEASLEELYTWIAKVMQSNQYQYELFFIDDGSADRSWEVITKLAAADANVKGIRFRKNYGKSQALNAGFKAVSGEVVITMDADLQDSPDEIPGLMDMIQKEGYDLVSGWKRKRYDPITKTLASFAIDLTDDPPIGTLLGRLRGERVELQAASPVTGTILGVEKRLVPTGDDRPPGEKEYITVLADDDLRTLALETVTRIRLVDADLQNLDEHSAVIRYAAELRLWDVDKMNAVLLRRLDGDGFHGITRGFVA